MFSFQFLQVNSSSADRVTQQIQSKFGDYTLILPYLDEPKRLIGISTSPPPPQSRHHSPVSSRLQPPTSNTSTQEFKKPHQGGGGSGGGNRPSVNSSSTSSSYGKVSYDGGRGGYPPQVKHPSHGRPPNGVLPSSKGPPQSVTSPSGGRVHGSSRNVPPRISIDQV